MIYFFCSITIDINYYFINILLKIRDINKYEATGTESKEILENITPEGIKEDAKEVIKDLEELEKLGLKGNVELKFTLKDKKISKLETKIQIDKMVKIETIAEFKYGNAKIEKIKYNEEALKNYLEKFPRPYSTLPFITSSDGKVFNVNDGQHRLCVAIREKIEIYVNAQIPKSKIKELEIENETDIHICNY